MRSEGTDIGGNIAVVTGRHTFQRAYQIIVWSRFSGGRRWPLSHWIKLLYGLAGLGFLVYTACSVSSGSDQPRDRISPPSSRLWQWTIPDDVVIQNAIEMQDIESGADLNEETQVMKVFALDPEAPWGTDNSRRNIKAWIGLAARGYLLGGIVAACLGILGGLFWAIMVEWWTRPELPLPTSPSISRVWLQRGSRWILNSADDVPKFILLFVIYATGPLTLIRFTVAMGIFLTFGCTALFRERMSSYLKSEPHLYAAEFGMSSWRIMDTHIIRRNIVPQLWSLYPYMLSAYIMYEVTFSFIGYSPGGFQSWGSLLCDNFRRHDWTLYIPLASASFAISSLYLLGDALRERFAEGNA